MKTYTEIVKEKLKEIEDIRKKEKMIAKKSYYEIGGKPVSKKEFDKRDVSSLFFKNDEISLNPKLEKLKANLSGMQTAIQNELEFLESFELDLKTMKGMGKLVLEKKLEKRITDCKNALKLIEEGK